MANKKTKEDLSLKMKIGLDKAREKLIAETKKNNTYLVIAGKDGKVIKLWAKDL